MTLEEASEVEVAAGSSAGDPLLLRPAEAAAFLGIGRTKLYELIRLGRLESVQIDRSRRVPRACLTAFVEELRGARTVAAST